MRDSLYVLLTTWRKEYKMAKFAVSVAETLIAVVTVDAEDQFEAVDKVTKAYWKGKITLGSVDKLDEPSIEYEEPEYLDLDGTEQHIEA